MKADLILKSRAIFTGLDDALISGSVVIKGNRILAVGETDLSQYDCDMVLDYGDKLILPGFVDAHVHYFLGAIAESGRMCTEIAKAASEEECLRMVKAFAARHPEEKRILGMGWFPANWNDAPLPDKRSLDAIFTDKPVYLISADVHTFWLNSRALEEAGITKNMRPRSGSVGKFENGELSGLLFEPEAFGPAMAKVMDFDAQEMKQFHKTFLSRINACGVTSISEMSADDYNETANRNYAVIKEMKDAGELTCRLHIYTRLDGYTDFEKAKKLQARYCSEKLQLSGVKGFLDGVTSTYTGLLLEPYSDRPQTCGEGVPGAPFEENQASVTAANKVGLGVRLHCIGDGAVRMALDLYKGSLKANGNHGQVNTIEHIESIHPQDLPRFARLGVIPSMQPYHLVLDQNEKISRIGEARCRWEWPHRSILDQGGQLAFGTDYPVVDFNPFPSIYAAVTRMDEQGQPAGANPQERISLAEALKAYTSGAARAYGREDIGALKEGKLADLAVVDRNLFAADASEIKDASVVLTVMDGKIVYSGI